jgi:hypothetical protein
MPDFLFELGTAGGLLLPPSTGGVTAGGPAAPQRFGHPTRQRGNGTLAGTFNLQPGVTAEAGSAVARASAGTSATSSWTGLDGGHHHPARQR